MNLKNALSLYAVTDRSWLGDESLYSQVEKAIKGGVSFIQLREKSLDEYDFIESAKEIKCLCNKNNVPFVINDNVEVALKSDADGVHLGQNDMSVSMAREILGQDKIIGLSARTVEQALQGEKEGANYLGVGAVFTTSTKLDTQAVSYSLLKEICNAVKIPVVAIGGVNLQNMSKLKGSDISGVAVVSAIFGQKDITKSTLELKKEVANLLGDN